MVSRLTIIMQTLPREIHELIDQHRRDNFRARIEAFEEIYRPIWKYKSKCKSDESDRLLPIIDWPADLRLMMIGGVECFSTLEYIGRIMKYRKMEVGSILYDEE